MAKIIIFGDIDSFPVYISVDGRKEMTVGGNYPRYIDVAPGTHSIVATTMNKMERISMGWGDGGFLSSLGDALIDSSNTTISGEIEFESDEALLIQLELKGMKTKLYNKMVSLSEANEYVEMSALLEVGQKEPRAPGEKNKWITLLLCLFFGFLGVHRFYEKKIFTGLLYPVAVILLLACMFANLPGYVLLIPGIILFLGWPIDFLRILFRRR